MTNEEARILLKKTKPKDNNAMSIMLREAMDMAIKALEQEPCEDAISREAVLEAIHEADMNAYDEVSFVRDLRNNINEIPSVYPKQKTGR